MGNHQPQCDRTCYPLSTGTVLRWVNDSDVLDLYVEDMDTDAFREVTGLELPLAKGGYVLSKRISRLMRPYFISGFFPLDSVSIRYPDQNERDAKIWDGAGQISRDLLLLLIDHLPQDILPRKRRYLEYELRHAGRVEFTLMTADGQSKGHCTVMDDLDIAPQGQVWLKPEYPISLQEVIIPTPCMPVQSELSVTELVLFAKNTLNPEPISEPKLLPKRSVRFYKQPLADGANEWLAQKVYLATGNLHEIEARQLIDKCGRKAVGQALGRMKYLREKGELHNPAGFMKLVSRVCWLASNGFDKPRPEYQYQSPKKRKPRKTAYNLKQDPIWQSDSYREWRLSFEDAPIDIWAIPCIGNSIE